MALKKAVHFGAGNIGRGFIGLLLSQAGCSVTFVDVNEQLVDRLNERKQYEVQYANDARERFAADKVEALLGSDLAGIREAIGTADLVTTAVGASVLKLIAPAIAAGIQRRAELNLPPLAVVACENAVRASSLLQKEIAKHLPAESAETLASFARFPDAAVDRIVPAQRHEDPLFVVVEPYYEWTIERSRWPDHLPSIPGVRYVERLDPYVERKLFTVNTGHASAAYFGRLKGCRTIQEAMQDERLVAEVLSVLEETGDALIAHYGLDREEHRHYIEQTLARFRNPHLTDEIARVGRSPIRKLSPQERFVRPALLAMQYGIDVQALPRAMAAALSFQADGDPEAVELQRHLAEHGVSATISAFTELSADHPLHRKIIACYRRQIGSV